MNPFQAAVKRLRAAGARGRVEFLKGNSVKTGTGAPTVDCEADDHDKPLQLAVEGYGCVDAQNLEEAVAAMCARLTDRVEGVAASSKPEAAPAKPERRKK